MEIHEYFIKKPKAKRIYFINNAYFLIFIDNFRISIFFYFIKRIFIKFTAKYTFKNIGKAALIATTSIIYLFKSFFAT